MFLFGILNFVFYFGIQSFISHNSINLLTPLDMQIPFIPEFVWVYHSFIPVLIITMLGLIKSKRLFLSTLSALFIAMIILSSFYVFLPAQYPRELWQTESGTISEWLVSLTRMIDSPGNCLPSGHNTFAWLLILFVAHSSCAKQYSWLKPAFFVWGVLVSISTLVLKQHYILLFVLK